jgi:tetratricopeptide (TPR) repeat protein
MQGLRSQAPALAAALLLALAAAASGQDWRGRGRIQGSVVDEDGQPIAGATLKAHNPERGGGTTVKTDKKGQWVLGGIAPGAWQIDIAAEGYETKKIAVNLPGEEARLAPFVVPLARAAGRGPAPELAAAAAAADAAYKAGRYAEARAEYQKLLPQRPDLAALLQQQIGFTYLQEKQMALAVSHLEQVLELEPENQRIRAIAAQAALEAGLVDKGRELLTSLDATSVDNADILFNLGVNFMNAGQGADAVTWFGKAIERDPSHVDAYYRRALARLGQGKMAEARTDFQKVVELSPEGEMATMARKALEQIQ